MSDQDKHSKTEEPTSKRLAEAREKGNIPRSRELASSLTLLTAIITLYLTSGLMLGTLKGLTADVLGEMGTYQVTQAGIQALLIKMSGGALLSMLPFFIIMVLVGVAVNYGQGGVVFTLDKLEFNLDKLNPLKGIERIFNKDGAFEGAKSLVKIFIAGYVGFKILRDEVDAISYLVEKDIPGIMEFVGRLSLKLVLHISGIMLILGILDLLFVKWRHIENLRMTKQEVKDEHKNTEGDPHIKAKIRQQRMAMYRQRLRSTIPKADVVVTNPTHYAVALKYDRSEMSAPVVLAKGVDYLALRIKEIARENRVMLVENRFLARELYAQVKEGEEIPEALYAAVAEVLAYVYSIKGKI
ncbi:flagellar biosynthetic protein FlhB [Geobacter sp. OR-1]|uniref:flagellar biosynthesis protein FlhB n=1 Tax=Geobacter sp. OR-1 TaxID=1266765 RepID=UPI00054276EE|nr:flagellar biosynthesis protein FlhB [Geobacter sp. OR-1]GAM09681.1 flagellar biosynthetic protein FlhB [Geobacter sp. OR-1]